MLPYEVSKWPFDLAAEVVWERPRNVKYGPSAVAPDFAILRSRPSAAIVMLST
jgi:hypothetical protein